MADIKLLISNKQKATLRCYARALMNECPKGIRTAKQSDSTHLLTLSWDELEKFATATGQLSTRQRVLRALFKSDITIDGN